MFLKRYFLVFCFFLIPPAYSKTQDIKQTNSPSKKPLVLQWQVSHTRNTDQISLIFREETVELVTNTSSYQKSKEVRLGWFSSPMDSQLEELKEQIQSFYDQLRKTVPLSTIIKDSRVKPQVEPHAPILRINEEQIQREHPFFKPMANIIRQVWAREWTCLECATYTKKRQHITRTVKKLKPDDLTGKTTDSEKKTGKSKKQWKVTKRRFTKKLFNCLPKGKNKVECIDPQFGIFKI